MQPMLLLCGQEQKLPGGDEVEQIRPWARADDALPR